MKITSEQRHRLAALYAKGDSLDASETAERAFLAGLAGEETALQIKGEAEDGDDAGGDDGNDDDGDDDVDDVDDVADGNGADGNGAPGAVTVGQRISAMVSSNKALAGKIAAANQRAAQAVANLTSMTDRAETAEASLEQLTGKFEKAETTIATLQAEVKTTDEAVTQALAGLNVPRLKMPKAGGVGSAEASIEKLNAEIEAETDPVRKGQLSQQAWDLMKAQSVAGKN